jgi:hypothetical protein
MGCINSLYMYRLYDMKRTATNVTNCSNRQCQRIKSVVSSVGKKDGVGRHHVAKSWPKNGHSNIAVFSHKNKTFGYITTIFQPLTFMWRRTVVTANEIRKWLPIFNNENGGNGFLHNVGTYLQKASPHPRKTIISTA